MLTKAISSLILFITCIRAHFLQCNPEDSLETVHEVSGKHYHHGNSEKAAVTCKEWPFYSGGFAPHDSYSHDSSSSEDSSDEDSSDEMSLLPDTITSDSKLYGYDDEVETHQCLESSAGYCTKWVTTKKEYEDKYHHGGCGGSHHHSKDETVLTEYQLCLCADSNLGHHENDHSSYKFSATEDNELVSPTIGTYCEIWACLETSSYPADFNAYSLVMDNSFVMRPWESYSSSSSSDSSDDDEHPWREPTYNGNYYRFAKDGEIMELDESLEFQNCWCKASALNGLYCLNWYCESLEHDEFGCHKEGFGVNDYGWFGCYYNSDDIMDPVCRSWYGFLVDFEERDEYRCECGTEDCQVWTCGLKEIPLRRNYMWYNFPLAMILWVCLCGCCGTKQCYKRKFSKCTWRCFKAFQCRKCRLFTFYIIIGMAALVHGGIPAFMFFNIFFPLSLCCARKCENCKCRCSKYRGCGKKWEMNKNNTELVDTNNIGTTNKDGEDSKERRDSLSNEVKVITPQEPEKVSKSGHIRVNSIDLDEMDGDVIQV